MTTQPIPMLTPRVTPEIAAENNDKVAERVAEEFEKEIKAVIENGIASLPKGPPRARLMAYLRSTLDQDLVYVMDPDYHAKRLSGESPKLLAEAMLQDYENAQQQMMQMSMVMQEQGIPYQPSEEDLPPKPPVLWPLLLRILPLKGTAFKMVQSDFRAVAHQRAQSYDFTGVVT